MSLYRLLAVVENRRIPTQGNEGYLSSNRAHSKDNRPQVPSQTQPNIPQAAYVISPSIPTIVVTAEKVGSVEHKQNVTKSGGDMENPQPSLQQKEIPVSDVPEQSKPGLTSLSVRGKEKYLAPLGDGRHASHGREGDGDQKKTDRLEDLVPQCLSI